MQRFFRRAPARHPQPEHVPSQEAKAPDDIFAGLPSGGYTWIAALGVTAALAAAGFIAKLSFQESLGVALGNWNAVDLSIFAGNWAFDTLKITLRSFFVHPLRFGLPIVLYLLPSLFSFSRPPSDERGQLAKQVSIVFATAGLLFALLWGELPTLSFHDWLNRPISQSIYDQDTGLLGSRESSLRSTLLVSKMEGIAFQGSICERPALQLPDNLRSLVTGQSPVSDARNNLEILYSTCVVICLAALLTAYFEHMLKQPIPVGHGLRKLWAFDLLLLLPLVTILTPYMYGKLLVPTRFPLVTVTFSNGEPTEKLLLIDETDKQVSLLNASVPVPFLVNIHRRDDIKSLQRYDTPDLLNDMLLPCGFLPPLQNTGPASTPQTP